MFYHAYEGYLDNAFPADELMPQSCKGRWRFPNRHPEHRGTLDEGFGKYVFCSVISLLSALASAAFARPADRFALVTYNAVTH